MSDLLQKDKFVDFILCQVSIRNEHRNKTTNCFPDISISGTEYGKFLVSNFGVSSTFIDMYNDSEFYHEIF